MSAEGGSRQLDREASPAVLVVDDEAVLLSVIARHLRSAGMAVTECSSAKAAIEVLGAQQFDVLLSDIDMPELSGIDLLRLLRERQNGIPVVLMTGAPTLETAMKAGEHGAFKYLKKPVRREELLEAVEQARKSRSAGSALASRPSAGPTTAQTQLAPGVLLAERYRLVRLLGEGGMGQVWEATQLSTTRAVAVKLMLSSVTGRTRSEMRARMLREARASSAVEHPNVVQVFDLFELADGTPVLVMELLRGRTLGDLLTQAKTLSLADVADLLLPVVSAVGTAHARGIIHRDLKPDNIFLAEEGGRTTVMVLDFGIAKLVSSAASDGAELTAAGTPMGTAGYMAPEQATGERDVDHRADIWSIGAILYEALSGVRPVQADTLGEMIKRLFTETPVPLAQRAPDVSPTVASLVDRMLARERDGRPSDLREVYAVLADHTSVRAPAFGIPLGSGVLPSSAPPPTSSQALAVTELAAEPKR